MNLSLLLQVPLMVMPRSQRKKKRARTAKTASKVNMSFLAVEIALQGNQRGASMQG